MGLPLLSACSSRNNSPVNQDLFSTQRLQAHRATQLDTNFAVTISHIEQFGHEVMQVAEGGGGSGWSYTVGLFDTSGVPEVIVVGLPNETAHFLLNEAARRLRDGVDLTIGRHSDLIDKVECEFRAVDRKWVEHLMGRALWYYDSFEFPVLQAIYPDLENRFPGEEGFDERFLRPAMQPETKMGLVEKDFWASADPSSSLFDWKFPDPPHTQVYLSHAVHEKREAITYVSHDIEDGAWQFLGDGMVQEGEQPVIVCFHHPIDDDPSLKELNDLPLGWWAERVTPESPWIRRKHDEPNDKESD